MFKIEKDIPVKEDGNLKGITSFLKTLEINDSFECSIKDRPGVVSTARYLGIKVKSAKQENGMVRIWRIA